MRDAFRLACAEIAAVAEGLDAGAVEAACGRIAGAGHVMVYGCGREALQLRGFAMRLAHLGRPVSVQGDMAAPPLGPGDLLLASAGPGELATVTALMRGARDAGADVLFLTARPETGPAALATQILTVPAQTMATDQVSSASRVLPMGSLYEGALFVLFEVMVGRLAEMSGETPDTMRARHTNME